MRAGGTLAPSDGLTEALDEARVREDFPVLARRARGKRLAYLDSAASAQKPAAVIEAVRDYYAEHHSNVHRGVHILSEEATAAYEGARETARRFLNAASVEEILFTGGTTAGVNLVAQSWAGANLGPGDEVILTTFEHHSNLVPWQVAAQRAGAALRVVPLEPNGSLDLAAYDALLGPRTRLVAVSHASNVLGTVAPLAEMTRMAHAVGALVFVDGAQSAPHFQVDVQVLDCDFYALSGHKLYGPTGIGVLFGRADLLGEMAPWQTGGGMIERVEFETTTWAPPPARFEAGTPPIAGAIGLGAAMDYVDSIGFGAISEHEQDLLAYLTARLLEVPGLTIHGTAPGKIGVVSFTLGDIHPHDVATVVDAHGVAVRAGHHCAQPLMRHLGVSATVRASIGLYNTRTDVDQLVEALHEAQRRLGG
ncbi:MAG: cysteine desulfurase [Gemmatimonadales bacterium]|nr:MAG: cysteine desulfurase [Gemmatimonadales bacterium]